MQSISLSQYANLRRSRNGRPNPEGETVADDEDYFCWRWSQQHFSQDRQILDEVLESEHLRSFLLELKLSRPVLGTPRFFDSLCPTIFEIYGHDPPRLNAMSVWAKNSKLTQGQLDHMLQLGTDPSGTNSFWTKFWEDAKGLVLYDAMPVQSNISQIWHARLKDYRFLRGIMKFLKKQYILELQYGVRYRVHSLRLCQNAWYDGYLLSSFTDPAQTQEWNNMDVFQERTDATANNTRQPATTPLRYAILLCVAGSGKSQRLFDYLSLHLGHYFVSGKVPSSQETSTSLLGAHRGLASYDTKILSEVMDSFPTGYKNDAGKLWEVLFENRSLTLRYLLSENETYSALQSWCGCTDNSSVSRIPIFKDSTPYNLTPHDWLLFQTLCTEMFDPFLQTFRILLLMFDRPDRVDVPTIFCLDEMQCEISDGDVAWPAYQPLDHFFSGMPVEHKNPNGYVNHFIGSGTSLQILKCQQIVSKHYAFSGALEVDDPPQGQSLSSPSAKRGFKRVDDLMEIDSDDKFHNLCHRHVDKLISRIGYLVSLAELTGECYLWKLLTPGANEAEKKSVYDFVKALLMTGGSAHDLGIATRSLSSAFQKIICCENTRNDGRCTDLLHSSLILRGRVRWSILFIEQLVIELFRAMVGYSSIQKLDMISRTDLNGETIRSFIQNERPKLYLSASKAVQKMIETQLRERVEELKRKNHYFLVKDLYYTSLRAVLLHRPTIFTDTQSAKMLEAGIAHLKPSTTTDASEDSLILELSEPIVLQAVVRHMWSEKSRSENILKELLFDNQDNRSTFGKVAEYYVAWEFGGLLPNEEASIIQAVPEKSRAFIKLLKAATLIPRVPASSLSSLRSPESIADLCALEEFVMEQPDPNSQNDIPLGSKLSFHVWLRRIRKEKYFPPIYFPSNSAGPDIVFCLRHRKDKERRILCAIQVKTGATKVTGEDCFKVIRTLDPNLWFQGYEGQRRDFIQQMQKFGCRLTILAALAVTSLPVEKFFASIGVLKKGLTHLQGLVYNYSAEFYNTVVKGGANPLQNSQSKYKESKLEVEKVIEVILKIPQGTLLVQDAGKIIRNEGKGAIKKATVEKTKIRGAIAISETFANRVLDLIPKGLAERATVLRFLEANKGLELAKSSHFKALKEAENELEKAAASISSQTPQGSLHLPDPANVPKNPIFDFYFTVLENKDLGTIFDEALGELTDAMKQIEAQKEVEEVETSEGENSDSETSEGEREEDSDQDVEMEDVASPTQNNKKRCASRPRFSSIKKFKAD